jgi:RNA polymerase sigma factor for flagellar operon FliA
VDQFNLIRLARQSAATAGQDLQSERERLIMQHLPQVVLIARRIQERLPESVVLDDLVSVGVIGLISAIDHFDPAQGVKLRTYAEYKIRGAILDSLRELDWAPRQRRRKAKRVESAVAAAEQKVHRAPSEEEVAAELNLSTSEYRSWLLEIRGLHGQPCEGRHDVQLVPDKEANLPSSIFEREELRRLLASIIEEIPPMEQTVLRLYYEEDMTLRQIAALVDLHESRISQLKTQAIGRLREHMEKHWPAPRGV